jgi:hypothetical protein
VPIVAAALLILAALVVAVVADGGGARPSGSRAHGPPLPNALVRIDPVAMRADRVAGIAPGPEGSRISATLAVGEGSVWVMDATLRRIDPASGEVMAETEWTGSHVEVTACCGSVWLARGRHFLRTPRPGLIRIGTTTGVVSATIAFPPGRTEVEVTDLAASGGVVVATLSDGRVAIVDVASERVTMAPIGGVLTSVAIGGEEILVADAYAGELVRLDRRSSRELGGVPVGGDPAALAIGEGSAWAVVPASGTLEEVDLATGEIDTYQVGPSPSDVAVGLGAIWVSDLEDGTVRRIDPSTGVVVGRIDLGAPVRRVVVDERTGTVWATTLEAP